MNSTNSAHEFIEAKLERRTGGAWKDRASDGLLEILVTAAPLRSATGRIRTQALGPEHEDPGESELPSEW